jgi:hypothetical protein
MGKYHRIKRKKEENEKIARERIEILEKMIEEEPSFAARYRELISKLKRKYRIKDKSGGK